MNKQEAIEKLESRAFDIEDTDLVVGLRFAQNTIKQINESKKPIVPQFVADWIEDNREALEEYVYSNVQIALSRIQADNPMHAWLNGKGIGIIVDCIRNGYEVEKEKLYTARLKLVTYKLQGYINKNKETNNLFVARSDVSNSLYQVHFTQTELEELDIWANSAFEIEEVTE